MPPQGLPGPSLADGEDEGEGEGEGGAEHLLPRQAAPRVAVPESPSPDEGAGSGGEPLDDWRAWVDSEEDDELDEGAATDGNGGGDSAPPSPMVRPPLPVVHTVPDCGTEEDWRVWSRSNSSDVLLRGFPEPGRLDPSQARRYSGAESLEMAAETEEMAESSAGQDPPFEADESSVSAGNQSMARLLLMGVYQQAAASLGRRAAAPAEAGAPAAPPPKAVGEPRPPAAATARAKASGSRPSGSPRPASGAEEAQGPGGGWANAVPRVALRPPPSAPGGARPPPRRFKAICSAQEVEALIAASLAGPLLASPPSTSSSSAAGLRPRSQQQSRPRSQQDARSLAAATPRPPGRGSPGGASTAGAAPAEEGDLRAEEQAQLRERFLENMRKTRAQEALERQRGKMAQEYRWLMGDMWAERGCRERERGWQRQEAERRRREEQRQRALAAKSDQELNLKYGRMYVSAPAPQAHRRAPPRSDTGSSCGAPREVGEGGDASPQSGGSSPQSAQQPPPALEGGEPAEKRRTSSTVTPPPMLAGDFPPPSPPLGSEGGGPPLGPEDQEAAALQAFLSAYGVAVGRVLATGGRKHEDAVMKQRSRRPSVVPPQEVAVALQALRRPSLRPPEQRAAAQSRKNSFAEGARRFSHTKEDGESGHASAMSMNADMQPAAEITLNGFMQLRSFLEEREGAALTAWIRHFDLNGDLHVSRQEFSNGMAALGWGDPEEAMKLFEMLDEDGDGELTLEEIDKGQAMLWQEFRHWCAAKYDGVQHMMQSFAGNTTLRMSKEQFAEALLREGWKKGCEDLIFASLDVSSEGSVSIWHFKWFEVEKRRWKMKEIAKNRSRVERTRRASLKVVGQASLAEFKEFLKRKYGGFVRAWRCVLSPNDSMTIYKPHFMKACMKMGWQGDARILWQAFDKDDSGAATIDELDPRAAKTFAHFRGFVLSRFGNSPAAFRALDRDNTKMIKFDDFASALEALGYPTAPAKMLFHGLDKDGKRYLVEEDLLFLDRWRPLPFLLAEPNPQAAEDIKAALLRKYRNFLSAWRQAMDKDSSNRCNWNEFSAACDMLGYHGDVAGAWRHLDHDLSGYITLKEVDPSSEAILQRFRKFADREFGGVRAAFTAFDADGSLEITRTEFKQACRIFGFRGDVVRLFNALDVGDSGTLTLDELTFLDTWERSPEEGERDINHVLSHGVDHPPPRSSHGSRVGSIAPGMSGRAASLHERVSVARMSLNMAPPPVGHRDSGSVSSRRRFGTLGGDSVLDSLSSLSADTPIDHAAAAAAATAAFAAQGGGEGGSTIGRRKCRGLPPGLVAWQSKDNPWHQSREGPLPAIQSVVEALLKGRPPPPGSKQRKVAAAASGGFLPGGSCYSGRGPRSPQGELQMPPPLPVFPLPQQPPAPIAL